MLHLVQQTPVAVDVERSVEPLGLRERKKRARREALIDAAQSLAREHGLDGVTIEAVCARAGVSSRTFFNYFETKDDAVLGVHPVELDPTLAALFAAGGPSGRLPTDLEHLVAGLVDHLPMGRGQLMCAMELTKAEPRLLARQMVAFERHHADVAQLLADRLRLPAGSARVDLLTMLVMSLVRATFVQWESGGAVGEVRDCVPVVVSELRALLADDDARPMST